MGHAIISNSTVVMEEEKLRKYIAEAPLMIALQNSTAQDGKKIEVLEAEQRRRQEESSELARQIDAFKREQSIRLSNAIRESVDDNTRAFNQRFSHMEKQSLSHRNHLNSIVTQVVEVLEEQSKNNENRAREYLEACSKANAVIQKLKEAVNTEVFEQVHIQADHEESHLTVSPRSQTSSEMSEDQPNSTFVPASFQQSHLSKRAPETRNHQPPNEPCNHCLYIETCDCNRSLPNRAGRGCSNSVSIVHHNKPRLSCTIALQMHGAVCEEIDRMHLNPDNTKSKYFREVESLKSAITNKFPGWSWSVTISFSQTWQTMQKRRLYLVLKFKRMFIYVLGGKLPF